MIQKANNLQKERIKYLADNYFCEDCTRKHGWLTDIDELTEDAAHERIVKMEDLTGDYS